MATTSVTSGPPSLRLGARGSLLSRMQSHQVAGRLEQTYPGLTVEFTVVKTSGDAIADRPLHEFGGKGLFTKELELALLAGDVDFAVHSFKDVPVTMPLVDQAALTVAAIPRREDPRDCLVSLKGKRIADLPAGAKVGTGSLRRQAQVLALRPDLRVEMLRGNVDTRIRKLRDGEYDAVILAMAGLRRAGLYDDAFMTPLEFDELIPAAGQGALALQCRRDDARTIALLTALHDAETELTTRLEREVVLALKGDCHSPIAAHARVERGSGAATVHLAVAVGAREGRPPLLRAEATAPAEAPGPAVATVVASLREQGVEEHLHGRPA